jgi:hypothetical protein
MSLRTKGTTEFGGWCWPGGRLAVLHFAVLRLAVSRVLCCFLLRTKDNTKFDGWC